MSTHTSLLSITRRSGLSVQKSSVLTTAPELNKIPFDKAKDPVLCIKDRWLHYQITASWLGASLMLYGNDGELVSAIRLEAYSGQIMLPSDTNQSFEATIENDLMQYKRSFSTR